jgi:hypothetical protein
MQQSAAAKQKMHHLPAEVQAAAQATTVAAMHNAAYQVD